MYCGNVRVYYDGAYSFFSQCLNGLGCGIVKFSGFADLDGSASNYQDCTNIGSLQYLTGPSRNSSNRNRVSWGPGELSGCHWTPKTFLVLCLMPSTVLSFTFTKLILKSVSSNDLSSTEYP